MVHLARNNGFAQFVEYESLQRTLHRASTKLRIIALMGDVMSDINGRRGMVLGMETEKNFTTLKALVPLKEMSSYSTTLSSLTGGRATFTMKFKSYELVPGDVQDKLIKEYEATQKDED